MRMISIDPFPSAALRNLPKVELIQKEVQAVGLQVSEELDEGDILFIDSTHVVKIDGDVPYLYLEILPRLQKSVIVHVHDVPFPYNVPYPPRTWIFEQLWPLFWNEAMLLQAYLCYNSAFRTLLSASLLRHFDEAFLRRHISGYANLVKMTPDSGSSIWIERTN